ncbi:hypothetical protein V8C26DRAFT_294670 [Trichoderma gracile]
MHIVLVQNITGPVILSRNDKLPFSFLFSISLSTSLSLSRTRPYTAGALISHIFIFIFTSSSSSAHQTSNPPNSPHLYSASVASQPVLLHPTYEYLQSSTPTSSTPSHRPSSRTRNQPDLVINNLSIQFPRTSSSCLGKGQPCSESGCALREGAARYHMTDRSSASCFGPDPRTPCPSCAASSLYSSSSRKPAHSAFPISILARASWLPVATLHMLHSYVHTVPMGRVFHLQTDLPSFVIGTPKRTPVRSFAGPRISAQAPAGAAAQRHFDFGWPLLRLSGSAPAGHHLHVKLVSRAFENLP